MKDTNVLVNLARKAMKGIVVEVIDKDDVNFICDYIKKCCDRAEDFEDGTAYDEILKYSDKEKTSIYGLSCSTVCDMPVINALLNDKGECFKIDSEDGVFCYCINLDEKMFSEYGYSFFAEVSSGSGYYHRVG